MTIENRLIARRVGACAMTALLAGVAFAEVVADPPRLSFSSPNQTQTLKHRQSLRPGLAVVRTLRQQPNHWL